MVKVEIRTCDGHISKSRYHIASNQVSMWSSRRVLGWLVGIVGDRDHTCQFIKRGQRPRVFRSSLIGKAETRYRELPTFKLGHPGAKTTGSTNTTILWNNITHLTDFEGLNWGKGPLACYFPYTTINVQNSITRAPGLEISKLRTFWKGVSVIYKLSLSLGEV